MDRGGILDIEAGESALGRKRGLTRSWEDELELERVRRRGQSWGRDQPGQRHGNRMS